MFLTLPRSKEAMLLGARREDVAAEVLRMCEELSLLQNSCKRSLPVAYACRSEYTVRRRETQVIS